MKAQDVKEESMEVLTKGEQKMKKYTTVGCTTEGCFRPSVHIGPHTPNDLGNAKGYSFEALPMSNGPNRPLSPAEEQALERFRKSAIHQCNHCGQCTVEHGWLIEKNLGSKPSWLTCSWSFGWTDDSLKAIRFSRREDAEQIASMFENDNISITEHQWC